MALTRECKKTVVARLQRDKKFARALYAEAMNALAENETQAGRSMLRDLARTKNLRPSKRRAVRATVQSSAFKVQGSKFPNLP